MPVPLGDSFNVAVARPVDTRSIWTGALENLNDTKNKYPGLFTYVTGANQYYYYVNDQWVYVQTVTTTNQTFSGVKNFSSRPVVNQTGIVLSGEAVSPYVNIENITANFNFISDYNSKLLTINSSSNIIGTVQLNLPIGYNVSFTQMGAGKLLITGVNGVNIKQRLNLYNTAGQYAIASLVHRGDNEYLLYGDLG